jgi:hypothetical protein
MGGLHEPLKNRFCHGRYVLIAVYIIGIPIGSINIDECFDEYIKTLLRDLGYAVGRRPASGEFFQGVKARLGTKISDAVESFDFPILGLDRGISDQKTGVSGGCVNVKR